MRYLRRLEGLTLMSPSQSQSPADGYSYGYCYGDSGASMVRNDANPDVAVVVTYSCGTISTKGAPRQWGGRQLTFTARVTGDDGHGDSDDDDDDDDDDGRRHFVKRPGSEEGFMKS